MPQPIPHLALSAVGDLLAYEGERVDIVVVGEEAVSWIASQDVSAGFRGVLGQVAERVERDVERGG